MFFNQIPNEDDHEKISNYNKKNYYLIPLIKYI